MAISQDLANLLAKRWGPFPAQEPMLRRTHAFFHAEEAKDLQSLIADKTEDIRRFDVAGMERATAICVCGRSGSILLASYLDGHDDVIMLPTFRSQRIYEFFEVYQSVSLYDKLIAYSVLAEFFEAEFPITATDYYAAVKALFNVYGNRSPEFLESRRAFFRFLHVAYCVALGRRPAGPHPLIVYQLHDRNDQLAKCFVEDFSQARFIHTVRDPITNYSRGFDAWWGGEGFLTPRHVIRHLTKQDIPHTGMESRTRAIRFEDMHLHLEKTMRAVADWLGLPYRSSLIDSTFNGVPWTVRQGTVSWSGARPEQAIRDSRNISFTDKSLLFAVFNEDFMAWNYPCPDIFRHASVRVLTCMLVLLIPLKIEIITAGRLIKELPLLWRGGLRYVIDGAVRIFYGRLAIMLLVAQDLCRRLAFRKKVLKLL